ncbi:LytR/AlgR family response regulator transcription factor [Kordia jejudonensis]|uniref:LytR/AlgR family response regulator transcription factor n=1 Tax=Kordia jejudonensis TaxID=1348245 RepID=UPI000629486B|nr:response regulator [Kordia jejudonensis]
MEIRYILIDDDTYTLKNVKNKIDSIASDYELKHVASYHSSKKAFEEINPDSFDLLIVDFQMPVYNGIQIAKKIANAKKIIFLTSTTGKQTEIINNLDIVGYLSKPFEIEVFEDILKRKIIGKIQNNVNYLTDKIQLSTGDSNYIFDIKDAFYITTAKNIKNYQAKKNYVTIYGKEDEVLIENIRMTISDLAKKLASHNFEKITPRTIINLSHIKSRVSTEITLHHSKEQFEINTKAKQTFISKLASFFRQKK